MYYPASEILAKLLLYGTKCSKREQWFYCACDHENVPQDPLDSSNMEWVCKPRQLNVSNPAFNVAVTAVVKHLNIIS